MTGSFRQSIAQSSGIRQSSILPTAMAQAADPQQPLSMAYEGIEGGTATAWAVILTALSEEHQAVEAHLQPIGQSPRLSEDIHPNGTIYTQGQFKTHNCTWNVAIAQIDMGNESAALEAERAINYFNPRVVLFVGVAGGIKGVEIGDVVAAPIVYSYDCGKVLHDRTLPRPKLGEATYDLKQRAMAEARKDDWQSRIHSDQPSSGKSPKVYCKPIAAGNKVVASRQSQVYEYLREYYDDAIAVEMEGFGFLKATQQIKNISAMVIRGISDLIDGKNDDVIEPESIRQERAARHASAFAFTLLAKLDGEEVTERSAVYETTAQVSLDSTLPEGLISLNLQALMEANQYYIHAHQGKRTFVEWGEFAPLLTRLPEQMESDSNLMNLVSNLDTCNAELLTHPTCPVSQFLKWLVISEDAEDHCLTIDDRTGLEIPWELLEVNGDPLGAKMQTIRQCPDMQQLEATEACCQGEVLAYATVRTYQWQTSYKYQHYSAFQEFLGSLQRPQADYGLVFIDGFGIQETLQLNPTAFIKRSLLFKQRSSIVFVNGQLKFDESLALNHTAFLTLFLRYGAKGVIGTLKQVDPKVAEKIVETFLTWKDQKKDQNCQGYPLTVPAILKQMRQQIHNQLNDGGLTDENCALYLATFLYVYYGNPQALLQLTPANV